MFSKSCVDCLCRNGFEYPGTVHKRERQRGRESSFSVTFRLQMERKRDGLKIFFCFEK